MQPIVLHNASTVTPEGIMDAYVLIDEGMIRDVSSEPFPGLPVIETAGVLMPGVIDPHVHINEPGRTDWEGFDTATRAAIYGGITTLVDMPLNALPVTTTAAALQEKIKASYNKLHAHCGFWGGIVPGNADDIEALISTGVLGLKAFLTHSGIEEFPNVTEQDLRKVMPIIAKHGLPLLVHCELSTNTVLTSSSTYLDYVRSRPTLWENDAIALMIKLSAEYNCHVHIVHLSSAEAIEPIRKAKQSGVMITVETAPHYLFFSAEEINDECKISGKQLTMYKCAPPIRERHNNDQLWQALEEGVIDFIATDHSPAPPDLKCVDSGDLQKAWGGIASLQVSLPAVWTMTKNRNKTVADVCKWMCENPVKLFPENVRKGKIAAGYDADLIIWNPEKKFTVDGNCLQHRHKITPYHGKELYGQINKVYLKGNLIFEGGALTNEAKGDIILNNQNV